MKVLLSAYACEADKGSEPFLGWRWAREIAKHHDVWVITRSNNRNSIEDYLKDHPLHNIHFCYIDLSSFLRKIKKILPYGIQLYYYLWQIKAAKTACKLNETLHFDLVHHLTFGAYTQPTFMWKLGIPFLWGPLGGGEAMPKIQGRTMDVNSQIYEILRQVQMKMYSFYPFTRKALKYSSKIIVTTEDTKKLIPEKYQSKTVLFQTLGIDEDFMRKNHRSEIVSDRIKILMVGRMIGWKGFDIGVDAFKSLISKYDNVDLYLRGNGPLKQKIFQQCGDLLNKRIFYVDTFFNYEDMYSFYKSNDIFLNCTLHDSGCLAMLEAMSASLPIVCIDSGGPHVITNRANAIKVKPKPYAELVEDLRNGLSKLIEDSELRHKMGQASRKIIDEEYLYEIKYIRIGKIYEEIISK